MSLLALFELLCGDLRETHMAKAYIGKALSTPQDERLFQQERTILEITELIAERMHEAGVTKAELARRLDKSRAYVTRLLDGRTNMTIRTISDVLHVLGEALEVSAVAVERQAWKYGQSLRLPTDSDTDGAGPASSRRSRG